MRHLLDTRPLPCRRPACGPGVWDPHLMQTPDCWLVAYVSAMTFFRFHPVLAIGPVSTGFAVRRHCPVLDLDLREVGELDAPYPSDISGPLVETGTGLLVVGSRLEV